MANFHPNLGKVSFPPIPPILPAPATKFSSDSSSPSLARAPAYELDPLLRSLSPEATLQALSSTDAVPNDEKTAHDILSQSISQVSQADRALGIRAAVAATNLTLWYKEVQSWDWPKRADAHLGKAFIPPSPWAADKELEYYGSLPSVVIQQHEARIEEIRDEMDSLGVDELKEHVLNAHIPSRSRPSSSNSTMSIPLSLSYVQLSDFTAVITATILRALPILSRLNMLLSTWDVRLLVLRQIPGLLRSLQSTREVLDDAFRALKSREPRTEKDALYSRSNFYVKQAELGTAVASAGKRMDNILDALEGREDSLPERWIDDLEAIESEFSTWVVEAEKRSSENEWMRSNAMTNENKAALSLPDHASRETAQRVSDPAVNESDSARRNDRPAFMETIEEEPSTTNEITDKAQPETQTPENKADSPVQTTAPAVHELSPVHADESHDPSNKEFPSADPLKETTLPSADADDQPKPFPIVSNSKDSSRSSPPFERQQSVSPPANVSPSASPEPALQREPSTDAQPIVAPDVTKPHTPSPTPSPSEAVPICKVQSPESSEPNSDAGSTGTQVRHVNTAEASPLGSLVAEAATTASPVSATRGVSSSPSGPSPGSSKPSSFEIEDEPTTLPSHEDACPPLKQPLESPIKLNPRQSRPEKKSGKPRHRRASDTSVDSLSDYPSLMSSPEAREPRTGSSNGTPLFLNTPPPQFRLPNFAQTSNHHTLREDRLRRFDNQKGSPHMMLKHNRTVSLPLQRFINERLDMNFEDDAGFDVDSPSNNRRPSTASHPGREDLFSDRADSTTHNIQRLASQRWEQSHDRPSRRSKRSRLSEPWEHKKSSLKESTERVLNSQPPRLANRSSKDLKATTSTESLGRCGSRPPSTVDLATRKSGSLSNSRNNSRTSTPNKQRKKDHLDEKISSILDTLPARIQLLSGAQDSDTSSVASSVPMKSRRYSSTSLQSACCETPAPSLTLTPAMRRRQSYMHGPEESSVKLYHLHRGGKTTPQRLFVRSVGEHGERVMVRVGGGWADLGEYLREYAIHHGRRHVSDTPRVEVQGLSSRDSTAYPSPGNMLTPTPNDDRTTSSRPSSRPRSVLSNRPPSSLAVRKTRRASNVSEATTDFRAPSAGESYSPLSPAASASASVSAPRRLSVSSNNSATTTSMASEAHHCSFSSAISPATTIAGGSSRSIPLGLAGPKPRSRQVSMDPESEAWVEDVLGQTRQSSSLRPAKLGIPPVEGSPEPPQQSQPSVSRPTSVQGQVPSLPKARSVSDMGTVGTSRRVVLRGLGSSSRRSSRQR